MEASIAVWGTRASKMGKILAPGNVLAVLVSSKTNTGNDGNVYVNLNARDLSVMKWGASADSATDALSLRQKKVFRLLWVGVLLFVVPLRIRTRADKRQCQ